VRRIFGLAALASVALLAGGVGQASASSTCAGNEYNTSNGGNTLTTTGTNQTPATDIGTVGPGCLEIGNFGTTPSSDPTANVNNDKALVNTSNDPSIYKFYWGGGDLTIQEEQGSNGIGYNIDVELALVSNVTGLQAGTNNSGGNLLGTLTASKTILQAIQFTPETIFSGDLTAGEYYLDTYLGTCGTDQSCSNSGDSNADPEVAMLFTPTTPLPATLPLFAGGLGFVGYLAKRRKQNAKQAPAAA
jgi:hypothetical protein